MTAAWGAIGGGGMLRTCFSKGIWRPIDTGASCKSGEQALDFYTKGGADTAFLGKTAKAADSDKLDGIDSTGFVQGNGSRISFHRDGADTFALALITEADVPSVVARCVAVGGSRATQALLRVEAARESDWIVWVDDSGTLTQHGLGAASDPIVILDVEDTGLRHIVIRAASIFGGDRTVNYDLMVNEASVGTPCQISGLIADVSTDAPNSAN